MENKIKKALRLFDKKNAYNVLIRHVVMLKLKEFKKRVWNQYFPIKPWVINFNANDICNSKCVMCNIWEQKQTFELSPEELELILNDPLFTDVKHIGITGGEPTLREDLPELYEACLKAIPGLAGMSIITNAIKEKDVIERIEGVRNVLKKYNKGFSMMVSLDGYKENHDKIRRREGNFESALNVINYFKNKDVSVAIGCTISKDNVWDVDELLEFLKENKLYGRFRIAEFINRLYNNDKREIIRNFDQDELYQLALFFKKLELTFETNPEFKRTYKSIHKMLLGSKRTIGCPYHSDGVVLNSRGKLQYCAPKSDEIGSAIEKSALQIFKSNLFERRRIIKNNCDSCIHDYHYHITAKEKIEEFSEHWWNIRLAFESPYINKLSFLARLFPIKKQKQVPVIFIVGWYGTETVGDKAIIAGIISAYKQKFNNKCSIVIGSIYPFITDRTVQELDIEAKVVSSFGFDFVRYAYHSDYVVMGGGPLMDLEHLSIPDNAFKIAKLGNKKRVIYGCGLGPLFEERYRKAVKRIILNSTDVMVRDNKSKEIALGWFPEIEVENIGDMAKGYIESRSTLIPKENKNEIACFLRDWTYEYSKNISFDEFLKEKRTFEAGLASFIKNKAKELNAEKITFYHMHNFVIGNDDREFSRYFIKTYFHDMPNVRYDKKLSTVDSIVSSMKSSKHNVCMRFHSVLFAHSLNTCFTAVDYTLGGKIYGYLKDNNALGSLVSVSELIKFQTPA